MTAKGELIRVIMFPKPMPFQFTQESMKWIGFLALLALCGMTYTLVRMVQDGEEASWVIRRTLDLVTIVIPPALPAAMTVGIVYAQGRLKKENIYCINSSLINVSAVVNVICFDKVRVETSLYHISINNIWYIAEYLYHISINITWYIAEYLYHISINNTWHIAEYLYHISINNTWYIAEYLYHISINNTWHIAEYYY